MGSADAEKSQLKRLRGSPPENDSDTKKPRRVEPPANSADEHPSTSARPQPQQQQPTPVTVAEDSIELRKEETATPPEGRPSQVSHRDPEERYSQAQVYSSPPLQDTQAVPTQQIEAALALSDEVEDEVKEGVWGYLFPLDTQYGGRCIVMKKRPACGSPSEPPEATAGKALMTPTDNAGSSRAKCTSSSGGYLIGRHPECDVPADDPVVSNRHCLLFTENNANDVVVVLEDLSSNGTFVNEAIVGRNRRRVLQDYDEIAVSDRARYIFRYPKTRQTSAFKQQYTLGERLGKGHFAEVYMCVEKSTGHRYAVKIFSKQGRDDRSKTEGLQQEIAVLMGVNHPNVLCLKDTFNERNHVYLVLELAPEGELFNFIVQKQKLTEDETRKLFVQLFNGVKYLHDRNIVHRDIKPENILMVDRDLHVKLADFGLAKIIGEESFTTTLCGTPSYVAPEILADTRNRAYTKAVDIWSLGVVLYICLCGFPPFSDELYSRDFPFTLSQQIKSGRFDYPSPYWDSVGDPALDLIDSMLVVDPNKRYTIDQCLSHPWMTQNMPNANDSTGGLVGGIAGLEVNRRGVPRERTLLSSLNTVQVAQRIPAGDKGIPVTVYAKNKHNNLVNTGRREVNPSEERDVGEFAEMGGRGDEELFGNDEDSVYSKKDIASREK
ncbi:hypothetical protein VUR80DRAFT_9980 [Thermomyces stellatus]